MDPSRIRVVEHHGPQFDVRGVSTVPRTPQGHPVLLQAGDYADVKARAASYGRDANQLKVFPAARFVLGDTPEAAEAARHIRRQQVSPQTAIATLEQVWQSDLSGYDPDGPLPGVEPAD